MKVAHDDQFGRHRQRPGRQLDRHAADGDRAAAARRRCRPRRRRSRPRSPSTARSRAPSRRCATSPPSSRAPTTWAPDHQQLDRARAVAARDQRLGGRHATRSRCRSWPACRRSPPASPCRRRRRSAPARCASSSAPGAPGQTSFTAEGRRHARSTSPSPATDTLADVRDKINAAGAGVTALIMTDASGSRLLIRSNATGAANAFRTRHRRRRHRRRHRPVGWPSTPRPASPR